jgi:beta-glucosidase
MPKAKFYGAPLQAAVESGRVPASRVEDAARRVLGVKLAAGLFSRPLELDPTRVGATEHRELALEAARESIVLLENRGDFLPLRPKANSTIAVLGPWSRRAALGGRGSSEVKPLQAVTTADGLRAAVPGGVRVETLTDWSDDRRVAAIAAAADVVVLALGLGPRLEGESLDRVGNDLTLPPDQVGLIERVLEATSRVVVVLHAGSAIAMDPWIDRVPAVVVAWYPGELGGQALAEILLGIVDPSGKLPLTFPRAASQLPTFGAFPERVSEYREGVFVGYRHFDANALEPLFPFGHGGSYTRFEYSDLVVESRGQGPQIAVDVRFAVRNAGDRAGAEVAQVYVHDLEASVARPPRELKGFARLELEAGQSREVKLTLGYRDLAFFDEATRAWTVEPGAFEVQVGASSRDLRLRRQFTYGAQ